MTLRVAVLGPGRAGRALAGALTASGAVEVLGVHGRQPPADAFADADVILVTVRDRDLPDALAGLLTANLRSGAIVLHASGALDPAAALDALRDAGHPAGTFHPLVPLTDAVSAVAALREASVGVDGDAPAIEAATTLAEAVGATVLRIPPGTKPRYHAAAVIASNFAAVLAAGAERELRRAGIDAAAARAAVAGLLRAAVTGIVTMGPERALTGPVSRGDAGTVARNLAALADDPVLQDLYVAASRVAVDLARATGTARLDDVERALDSVRGSPSR